MRLHAEVGPRRLAVVVVLVLAPYCAAALATARVTGLRLAGGLDALGRPVNQRLSTPAAVRPSSSAG